MNPGAIGLVPVEGWAGIGIKFGEMLLDGKSDVQHAFILLDDDTVLEAQPNGAQIVPLSKYNDRKVIWLDPPLSDEARGVVVRIARTMVGVRYDWWAYLWLFLNRLGFRPKWVLRKVDNPKNDMCSQLADRVYRMASEQVTDQHDKTLLTLFTDGRDPGDVTPGDLAYLAEHPTWTTT